MNDLTPIRSAWNESLMIIRGRLTDRKIAHYQRRGFYSREFREKRKEVQDRKKARRMRREGNFLVDKNGGQVYSPLLS